MKTKEIDVWICSDFLNGHEEIFDSISEKKIDEFNIKAKLIIEIPEKKIEITESEFDEAYANAGFSNNLYDNFKKELGF